AAVGDGKAHLAAVPHDRALLDQPAEAEALAVARRAFRDLARAAEELDPIPQRVADERRRHGDQQRAEDDELDSAPLSQACRHSLLTAAPPAPSGSAPRSPRRRI